MEHITETDAVDLESWRIFFAAKELASFSLEILGSSTNRNRWPFFCMRVWLEIEGHLTKTKYPGAAKLVFRMIYHYYQPATWIYSSGRIRSYHQIMRFVSWLCGSERLGTFHQRTFGHGYF